MGVQPGAVPAFSVASPDASEKVFPEASAPLVAATCRAPCVAKAALKPSATQPTGAVIGLAIPASLSQPLRDALPARVSRPAFHFRMEIPMKSGQHPSPHLPKNWTRQHEQEGHVVPSPAHMHHTTREDSDTVLEIDAAETPAPFEGHAAGPPAACRQAEDPLAYFRRMRLEQPALLDRNVNALAATGQLAPITPLIGQVRAVLSNRCRCLINFDAPPESDTMSWASSRKATSNRSSSPKRGCT